MSLEHTLYIVYMMSESRINIDMKCKDVATRWPAPTLSINTISLEWRNQLANIGITLSSSQLWWDFRFSPVSEMFLLSPGLLIFYFIVNINIIYAIGKYFKISYSFLCVHKMFDKILIFFIGRGDSTKRGIARATRLFK